MNEKGLVNDSANNNAPIELKRIFIEFLKLCDSDIGLNDCIDAFYEYTLDFCKDDDTEVLLITLYEFLFDEDSEQYI